LPTKETKQMTDTVTTVVKTFEDLMSKMCL